MSDREFDIGGRKFKLCKIDAFKQFHIVRRIGPIMSELLPAVASMAKQKGARKLSDAESLEQAGKVFAPIMNGLSKLSDEDADRVLFGLLSSVEVQQSAGNWAKVSTDSMLMMQDMDLPTLVQAAGKAFMYNLGSFISAPQRTS